VASTNNTPVSNLFNQQNATMQQTLQGAVSGLFQNPSDELDKELEERRKSIMKASKVGMRPHRAS
jgi:hypothetical protein